MPIQTTLSLHDRLISDCELMIQYALSKGKSIPGVIVRIVEEYKSLMAQRAIDSSTTLTPAELGQVQSLISVHDFLSKIVDPATPESIRFLIEEEAKPSRFKFVSKITFIREMMLAAIISLIAFVGLSTFSFVAVVGEESSNIFDFSGFPLLINLLFLMSAAGLGASFASLFKANRYIVRGTFEPRYKSSYWLRFTLGIISGLLLAALIPLDQGGNMPELEVLTRPTLAMLGGFSVSLVYRVLMRLVEAAEQFFGDKPKEVDDAERRTAKVRNKAERDKSTFIRRLTDIQNLLNQGGDADMLKAMVNDTLGEFVLPTNPTPGLVQAKQVDGEYTADEEKQRKREYHLGINQKIEDVSEEKLRKLN